jgi:hypothetical protein
MQDGQDRQEPVDHSADLEEPATSPGEAEPEVATVEGEADEPVDELPGESERLNDSPTSELDAPMDPAESSKVLPVAEEAEPIDPEIAALQAELEAETDTPEPVASEAPGGAESPEASEEAAIAPAAVGGVEEASEDSREIVLPDDRAGVPIWPFLVYFALWIVFAGLLVWQSMQIPAGTPVYELDFYGMSILAGLALTAIGPLLALGVWVVSWFARPASRAGLFSRSLIMGAVTTLAGVALWLIALGAVDMLRLGRLL